ncbi:hypothetical protein [Burkholderia multivorans]|uniref:hypothetical protein n=1 Tax=Burkholderia multivorans TaxID=87883 RepID=UPI0021C1721B|nr:hypothetical protein [Burkholderia multivorans]
MLSVEAIVMRLLSCRLLLSRPSAPRESLHCTGTCRAYVPQRRHAAARGGGADALARRERCKFRNRLSAAGAWQRPPHRPPRADAAVRAAPAARGTRGDRDPTRRARHRIGRRADTPSPAPSRPGNMLPGQPPAARCLSANRRVGKS